MGVSDISKEVMEAALASAVRDLGSLRGLGGRDTVTLFWDYIKKAQKELENASEVRDESV